MSARVTPETSLFEYFRVRVEEARAEAGVDLTDEGALYLAQLLADRARLEPAPDAPTTLVELHVKACAARPAEQASTWRELGDRALHDLGFFPEHVEGRAVSRRYYEDMGASAYARVDEVLRRWFASAFGDLFRDLAAGFRGCVDVLHAVRERHDAADDLAAMYEEWMATGSEDLARRLRRRGLVLPRRVVLDA